MIELFTGGIIIFAYYMFIRKKKADDLKYLQELDRRNREMFNCDNKPQG